VVVLSQNVVLSGEFKVSLPPYTPLYSIWCIFMEIIDLQNLPKFAIALYFEVQARGFGPNFSESEDFYIFPLTKKLLFSLPSSAPGI